MLNYEKIKKKIIIENMEKVFEDYMKPDFQKKIDNYCEKFKIKKEVIIKKIQNKDKITMSIFAKDPSKQNFYEKTAAEFIKKIRGVKDFKNLPNGGKNSLYVDRDNIRKKTDFSGELPSKSIDFKWMFKSNNVQYYAFHKYIKQDGGAQDNQFNDVLNAIKNSRSTSSNLNHRILFICDGKYFTNTKMGMLKSAITNSNHIVISIEDVEKYLNK